MIRLQKFSLHYRALHINFEIHIVPCLAPMYI